MDTLRAIAILLVILAHSILSYGAPAYIAPLQLGGIGVDLFFVLSGWLLGGQLFKEQSKTGNIDIKRFWIRRWMRTLPAYYAVLSVLIVQQYISTEDFSFPWSYIFFVQNYNENLSFFSISWSLCVEEQFYLLIAPTLFFLHRLKPNQITVTLTLFLLTPLILRNTVDNGNFYSPTHLQLDCCIMGVLLAHIKYQQAAFWKLLLRYILPIAIVSIILFVGLFVLRYVPSWGYFEVDNLILAFVFGSWVALANKDKQWQSKLNIPLSNYIATRSYGMYLLHPEMLTIQKKLMLGLPFGFYFIISVIGSALLAEVLFRAIEKPFINMRESFSFSRSN